MNKRLISIVSTLGLIAGLLVIPITGARAQAVAVPAEVQITDPKGDANFVNDQDNAYGTPLAGQGDLVGPADVGTATDILRVWFTNTASDISLNVELEGNPTLLAYDTYFRFNSNAGKGAVAADETRGCLQWIASINGVGGAYTGATEGTLVDKCNVGGAAVAGPLTVSETADKTFVLSITFSRSYSPLLADGQLLTAPFGVSRIVYVAGPGYPTTAAVVTIDNTKRGSDYVITSGGAVTEPEPQPTVNPPGHNDPPGKGQKKGCGKGKGKQKGACGGVPGKPKSPAPGGACTPSTPAAAGKDKPTVVITDAATESAPVEQKVTVGASLADARLLSQIPAAGPLAVTVDTFNIQVDPAAANAGLWVSVEFPTRRDIDLSLFHPDGSYAARARSFNPVIGTPAAIFSAPGHGGEGTDHSEKLLGIRTNDCGGWTLAVENHFGENLNLSVKLWLGEAKTEPQEAGKEKPS